MEINDNTEPILLNYGSSKINQQDFLNNVANNVESYLASQPWSSKRKELFRKAYDNIMSLNVTGADNSSGSWKVTYEGDQIPFDTLSRKEREMYGEAAYFIQQQMQALTPVNQQDEKKDKQLFDNKYFTSQLNHRIGLDVFGGRDWDNQTNWNVLDSIGDNGLRGTSVRAGKLANVLENYANSLKEGDLNFEGTSFTNLNDFKTKALNVAANLRNGTWTPDMLNELGLDPNIYLSDGRNDIVSYQGRQMTREDYNNYITEQNRLQEQSKLQQQQASANQKQQQKIQQQQAINQSIQSSPFKTMTVYSPQYIASGWSINQLANKYGKDQQLLIQDLNTLSTKSKLTPDEQSLLIGAYRNAPKVGISKEEFDVLKRSRTFQNRAIGDFQRIKGVDNIIYDKKFNRFIFARNIPQSQTNWLEGKSDKEIYDNRTSMSTQDWTMLASVVPDIMSIMDVEPATAAALAASGSAMRNVAQASKPGNMTASEIGWQALDYLGAAFAAVPLLGDAYLVARVANTIRKIGAPLMTAMGVYGVGASTKNIVSKIMDGKKPTPQEWTELAQAIPMMVAMGKGRVAANNKNAVRAASTGKTKVSKGSIDVNVNGTKAKIKGISEGKAKELQSKFKEAGNDNAKKTEILKSDSEVQRLAQEQNIDLNNATIETPKRLGASYRNPTEIVFEDTYIPNKARRAYLQEIARLKSSSNFMDRRRGLGLERQLGIYETTGGNRTNSNNWFSNIWNSITGKNSYGEQLAERLNNPAQTQNSSNRNTTTTTSNQQNIGPLSSQQPTKIYNTPLTIESGRHHLNRHVQLETATQNRLQRIENGQIHHKPTINEDITTNIGNESIKVKVNNGRFKLTSDEDGRTIIYPETSNVESLQKQIAEVIRRQHNKIDSNKLRELRKLFGLKQGGTIDKQKIQRYKEFMKK